MCVFVVLQLDVCVAMHCQKHHKAAAWSLNTLQTACVVHQSSSRRTLHKQHGIGAREREQTDDDDDDDNDGERLA